MIAKVISIGNEILIGKTINTNLTFIGRQLSSLGIQVTKNLVIRDEFDTIKNTILTEFDGCDLLITTGGLGPTTDDISKNAIAEAFGKKLIFSDDQWERIAEIFKGRGIEVPETNKGQALYPEGFELLDNAIGTAPGLMYRFDKKIFVAMPGVPREMEYIINNSLLPIMSDYSTDFFLREIHTAEIPESEIAERLQDMEVPDNMNVAFLPSAGKVTIRLYGQNKVGIKAIEKKVIKRLHKFVWGYDDVTLVQTLFKIISEREFTISVAESCTGGLLQKMITDEPGASAFFKGGVTAYANEVKISMLNVNPETLKEYGAVSSQTAEQMADGVRKALNADIGVSVTGIAGPDGGSDNKPVGTVFIGYSDVNTTFSVKYNLFGNRSMIRSKAADRMILTIIRELKK